MNIGKALVFVFDETTAFLGRAWWLGLVLSVPIATRYLTGLVETPWSADASLLIVGALNALAFVALLYWVPRFIALKHDVSHAVRVNAASARPSLPMP